MICTRCLLDKPESEFFKRCDNAAKRLRSHCKICHTASYRLWVEKNKDYVREKHRIDQAAWCAENPERAKALVRKSNLKRITANPALHIWKRTKYRAEQLGVPFDLEPGDIVLPEFCPISGTRIELNLLTIKNGRPENSPSIDRIVPSLGYVKGNVQIVADSANRRKNNMTLDDMKALLHYQISNWPT